MMSAKEAFDRYVVEKRRVGFGDAQILAALANEIRQFSVREQPEFGAPCQTGAVGDPFGSIAGLLDEMNQSVGGARARCRLRRLLAWES